MQRVGSGGDFESGKYVNGKLRGILMMFMQERSSLLFDKYIFCGCHILP